MAISCHTHIHTHHTSPQPPRQAIHLPAAQTASSSSLNTDPPSLTAVSQHPISRMHRDAALRSIYMYQTIDLLARTSAGIVQRATLQYRHSSVSISHLRDIQDTMATLRSTWFFQALHATSAVIIFPLQATAVTLDASARGDEVDMSEAIVNAGSGDIVSLARVASDQAASPDVPSALSTEGVPPPRRTTARAPSSSSTRTSSQGRCGIVD